MGYVTGDKSTLTGFYGRARSEDWHQEKQENHRRWRRRAIGIGSASAVVVLIGGFIVYDYPRESGLTDALGMTCGEYVHLGAPEAVPSPTDAWETYQDDLMNADELDGAGFLSAVEVFSEELDAEAQMGHVYETITQRQSSAVAAGETLVIGHHEEFWSATDRVSVLDPETNEITWTAELIHPVRDQDLAGDDRPRVLYGVGTTEEHVVPRLLPTVVILMWSLQNVALMARLSASDSREPLTRSKS